MDQMERAAQLAERAEQSIRDGAFGKAQAEALTSIALAMTHKRVWPPVRDGLASA